MLAHVVVEAVQIEKHLFALGTGKAAAEGGVVEFGVLSQRLLLCKAFAALVANPRAHVGVPRHVALHVLVVTGAIAAHAARALAPLHVQPHVRLYAAAQVVRLVAVVALVPFHRRVNHLVPQHEVTLRERLAAHVAIVLLGPVSGSRFASSSLRPSENTHHRHVGAQSFGLQGRGFCRGMTLICIFKFILR